MSGSSDADPTGDDAIQALREALRASPNNSALRLHFADLLLGRGHAAEAEKEFREGVTQSPNSVPMKLGLARAFMQLGKHSQALVIVEDLVKNPNAPARTFLLHARLLAGVGEIQQAIAEYKRAIQLDSSIGDAEFAARDRKSTRLNSSHSSISYAVFCLKKKKKKKKNNTHKKKKTNIKKQKYKNKTNNRTTS